ncbi:MAG: DUF1295 domain-containing protein [Planctomycetota bacterium]
MPLPEPWLGDLYESEPENAAQPSIRPKNSLQQKKDRRAKMLMLYGLLICLGLFLGYWIIQYLINNSAIVDVFWAASVAVVGVFFVCYTPGDLSRRWLLGIMVAVWAARLSFYLFLRWKGHEEDARYTDLKEKWGESAQLRMLRFYQMQGLGAYLFSLPILVAGYNSNPIGFLDYVGVAIWLTSLIGETVADRQLAKFKSNPDNRGEVCKVGLWKYSRHPNYFFEWLHWCAYVPMSLMVPWGWLTVIAPIAMYIFLNRVTGIPLTEKQAVKSRGEKYREYQRTTNAFFPWFPTTES